MSSDLVPFKNSQGRFVGVQCSATSKQTGNRCRRFTGHPGLKVCRFHGGNIPVVRAAADRRLVALGPKAIRVLDEILEGPPTSARFRAAKYVLRMAGINSRTLWEDEKTQLAIEAGGPSESADDQIEELLSGLRDSPPDETSG